ncbi:LysR substrate-binding domain-containing protein [Salipiger aestuarii]|uniref:LysR substrate-binding domain-containing protein n=1 Tax=Salipiger aestuarii TaxID=568098 RepID=UPI00123AF36A|nr:LysR substrate-binding domain-containing protein [Salipiger aestuarii]
MKLTTTQIEAFSAVLAVGTATGAASILNTSQPSVSRSIKQLEDATGLRLFDRSKGGFLPTAAAVELSAVIEESYRGMNDIRRTAEAIRKRETKQIRIACLPAFSNMFLADAISRLMERDPTLSVSVQSWLSKEVHSAVHKGLIDIGIAAYEVDDPNLSVHRYTTMSEVVLLQRSHPLVEEEVIRPQHLSRQNLILLSAFDPYRIRLDNLLASENVYPSRTLEAETSAGACALVACGMGAAIVNPITALEYLDRGLVIRPFSHDLPFVTTVVSAKSGSQPRLVREFEKTLVAKLALAKAEIACRLCSQ